ncbi:MAG: substrate-binding domain-containing protein [Desulfobacteria bacterium]
MRPTSLAFLLTAGILFSLPAAGGATTLTIPGAGSCESVLRSVATVYEQSHPLSKVVVPPSAHSEGGIRQVIDGTAVLARVSRPLTPVEVEKGLTYRVFARDAVVFAVGDRVRARDLTIRQLADIFSGKIGTWEELNGGKGPIRVLYRQTAESNTIRLRATFKEFRDLRFTDKGKALYYIADMLEMLRKYGNSIGFLTRSTVRGSSVPILPLSIDGVAPTKENIVAGRYPLVIDFALVYRKDALPPEAREFVDFLFSGDGKKTLSGHGLVPVGR